MFDRIGRIADETPFVVEWFVKNGIRVWSTQEGEQRFDTHADRLMNYIRFWQADGESEKTSIRTRTRLGQVVEEGHFKGGFAPYGYRLVEGTRVNKRRHRLYELEVVKEEAAVVRMIYEKYVLEGYGAQRIATFLNEQGYRAKTGKQWHHASIRGMLCNLTYTGVLRCGQSRSEPIPDLQIIPPELFERAQSIRKQRHATGPITVPRNTRGKSLLVGNIYCAHCGSRLCTTTNTKKDAAGNEVVRLRYICYGKSRKQTMCDGQTGYLMHKVDDAVDSVIRQIFARMKGIPRQTVIDLRCSRQIAEQKTLLQAAQSALQKAEADLATLQGEIAKSIRGESAFAPDTLSRLVEQQEQECVLRRNHYKALEAENAQTQENRRRIERQYDAVISMAELYDAATMAAKKMVVSQMIERVEVARGYDIHIVFRQEFREFLEDTPEKVSA